MGEPAGQLPVLGWDSLALSLVSLGAVCLLAYLALRFLARRGLGRGTGPVRVLARCPLEPRRSVYLIETAGRCFMVGVGEGAMSLLAEIDRAELDLPIPAPPARPAGGSFAEVLARVLSRPPSGAGAAAPPPRAPPADGPGPEERASLPVAGSGR